MQAAVREHVFPIDGRVDEHCLAASSIARHCSMVEAALASVGKELQDLFSVGDAQLSDLQADWRGIQCAQSANDDAAMVECCSQLR